MTAIEYPHGRTVRPVYTQASGANRPTSINDTKWDGGQWLATPVTALSNIAWELRRLRRGADATGLSVAAKTHGVNVNLLAADGPARMTRRAGRACRSQ